jgi:hypothetical protein
MNSFPVRVVHDAGRPGLGQIITFIVLDRRKFDLALHFCRPEIDVYYVAFACIRFVFRRPDRTSS